MEYSYAKAGSFKEFRGLSINAKDNQVVTVSAIVFYVVAAITLFNYGIFLGVVSSLVDVLFMVIMGIFLQKGANRGCAVALLVYSVLAVVFRILLFGRPGITLILLFASIPATVSTSNLHKRWKVYIKS